MKKTMIRLTDEELEALSGHCRPEVQKIVDAATERLAIQRNLPISEYAPFIAKVVQYAQKEELLIFQHARATHCEVCEQWAGYAKYKRNSQYHKKGDDNYDRPLTLSAIEMAKAFIRVKDHLTLGCCTECFNKLKPELGAALENVHAEIPEAYTGHPPKFKKYKNMKCVKCGWEGNAGEMGWGGRTHSPYPNKCPSCKVIKLALGPRVFLDLPGWTLVEVDNGAT